MTLYSQLERLEAPSQGALRDEPEPNDWSLPIECESLGRRIVFSWAELSQSPLRSFSQLSQEQIQEIRESHTTKNPYALELHALMREEADGQIFLWVFRCGEFQPSRWCLDFEGLWLLAR